MTGDRVRILSGRVFDARDPHAVMIDQQLAAREHLHPGSTLRLFVIPSDKAGNAVPSLARLMSFKVSAVVVFDTQIVPASRVNAEPMALVSPPFAKTPLALSASFGLQAGVRLRPGASAQSVVRAATVEPRKKLRGAVGTGKNESRDPAGRPNGDKTYNGVRQSDRKED